MTSERLNIFFRPLLKEFVFLNLQPAVLENFGMAQNFDKVMIPFDKGDIEAMHKGGLSGGKIAENMCIVVGCDPGFKFVKEYMEFVEKVFVKDLGKMLVARGIAAFNDKHVLEGLAFLRLAQLKEEKLLEAHFNYGLICRNIYEDISIIDKYDIEGEIEEDEIPRERLKEAIIGSFKAESMEVFEDISIKFPEFSMAYYFLGYDYLNMGLYKKSQLAFKKFVELNNVKIKELEGSLREDPPGAIVDEIKNLYSYKNEIEKRVVELEEPCEIEEGCNLVARGIYGKGCETLLKYKDNEKYSKWWPMFYYLGEALRQENNKEAAIGFYKDVLKINPGHVESMKALSEIYFEMKDSENYEKYIRKLEAYNKI